MDKAKSLLTRLQSLEKGDGLRRARFLARLFWFVGLALCIFIVFGVYFRLNSVVVGVAAAAMGWVVAETNALRTRLAQWPLFKRYIDWNRVEEDLNSGDNKD